MGRGRRSRGATSAVRVYADDHNPPHVHAGLAAGEFRGQPSAKVADEPEHLVEGDFIEERLYRLVRQAVDAEERMVRRS